MLNEIFYNKIIESQFIIYDNLSCHDIMSVYFINYMTLCLILYDNMAVNEC